MATRTQRAAVASMDAELQREAAEWIVSHAERYGGEESLMVRCSRRVLERLNGEGKEGGTMK